MNETMMKKLAKPMIVCATLIWGSTFFILKDALDNVDLMFLMAFRFGFAAVLLGLVFWKRWKTIDRSYWWRGGLLGLFMFLAYSVQNYGLTDTTPGKNAFFTAVYCVIVPFLYWGVDRLRPSRFNVLAALLCIGGIGLVSWDGGIALTRGDVLTLCGGLLYACHIVAVAKFSQGRDAVLLSILQFGSAALCFAVGTAVTQGVPAGGAVPQRVAGAALSGGVRHHHRAAVPERGAEVHRPLLRRPAAGVGGPLRGDVLRGLRGGDAGGADVPGLRADLPGGGVLGDAVSVSAAGGREGGGVVRWREGPLIRPLRGHLSRLRLGRRWTLATGKHRPPVGGRLGAPAGPLPSPFKGEGVTAKP